MLRFNEDITKYMAISRLNNTTINTALNLSLYNFGEMGKVKYLRMILIENNETIKEVENRIQAENKSFLGVE